MTLDLEAATRALLACLADAPSSDVSAVLGLLAAFRADPSSSGWYGFVVRLGMLVEPEAVRHIVGAMDPYPGITTLALADAGLARTPAGDREVDAPIAGE